MRKERRTCGTCAHCEASEWHCDSKESEYSWMVDIDDVDLPCGGYGYERRADGLAERHERLAQVAREMLELLETTIDPYCEERCPVYAFVPGQGNCIKKFRDKLEECGVSVDD